MFMAQNGGRGNDKSILSMSPLVEGTPPFSSLSVLRKLEEMVTCSRSVNVLGAIITVKSCTILSSSLSSNRGRFLGA